MIEDSFLCFYGCLNFKVVPFRNDKIPFVKIEPTLALPLKTVTVVPPATVVASTYVGTRPQDHVLPACQSPSTMLVSWLVVSCGGVLFLGLIGGWLGAALFQPLVPAHLRGRLRTGLD